MFRITLIGTDGARTGFRAPPGRSLVKAAAAAGIVLTTGCLQGRCTICRARLLEGHVAALRRPSVNARCDPAARADGCVLTCSVGALSDLVIEPLSPWVRRDRGDEPMRDMPPAPKSNSKPRSGGTS